MFFKDESTYYQWQYRIFGIKITKRKVPSKLNLKDRIKFLKEVFKRQTGYELNLSNPKTFNEKINWMKLFYRNDLMTRIVDKYEFKNYIKEVLGEEYTVPLLGVWDNVNDIDFNKLPDKFVLKSNAQSDSKCIEIIRNKNDVNIAELKQKIKKWLVPTNTLVTSFCRAYYKVKPLIIAEEYIEELDNSTCDYKFFCFHGKVYCFYVTNNWVTNHDHDSRTLTFYDTELNQMPFVYGEYKKCHCKKLDKPVFFDEMIKISERLSKDFPFVRVDFFDINNKLYIGEMTFYPGGGYNSYSPFEWNYKLGQLLDLDKIENKYLVKNIPKTLVAVERVINKNEEL